MHQIRIILTCVGGLIIPSLIKSLKTYFNNIYIVGIDASENAIGFYFVDTYYKVHFGNDPIYPSEVLDIAIKEKIDLIIPFSDEETLALSKFKVKFLSYGIKILCSEYSICEIAFNKGIMLNFLKDNGIETPKFKIPYNNSQLKEFAKELGYPIEKIVFKPNISRGARGFWIVDENFDEEFGLLIDTNRKVCKLENIYTILSKCETYPSILLMEYLAGKDFNVEVLAKNGECIYIIPHVRLYPQASPVQVGLVQEDKKIYDLIKKIVKIFKFDYYLNIELAYNTELNKPMIYEINARAGAPIIITEAAGVNILAKGIEMAMGIPIEKNLIIQETMMIRYWTEYFVKKPKFFKS